jgi:hypothetical protein
MAVSVAGSIMSTEKASDIIDIRTSDLPASSIVPQSNCDHSACHEMDEENKAVGS